MFGLGRRQENVPKSVEDRLTALESDMKRVAMEWEDVYDRVLKAVARLNKRDRDAAKAGGPPNGEMPAEAAPLHPKAHLYSLLRGRNALSR